jgi:methylase of polypeptide subunit release factors
MKDAERRAAAKQFAADWKGRGDEKQETQTFWLALLQKVYGITEPDKFIQFEKTVRVVVHKTGKETIKFIDGYIPETKVLIEQKGMDINLDKGEKQSDGAILTPYQQARNYGGNLDKQEQPRWIIVCNFREFRIHDMNHPNDIPEVLLLADLEKEYHRLDFLVDTGDAHIKKEMEISLKAGDLVGVLYDALLKQYADPTNPETLKSLNALCVRLVFCLYAEDAGIFGKRDMFHDYLQNHRTEDRRALINLFRVLDQKPEERDKYLDEDLAAFPYVNGGLFADENIEIPRLGDAIIDLILSKASEDFDWSAISPTIFGAVFESTLNPETRRSGGMHYTSIENIHKVIDPLFLDDLKAELKEIRSLPVNKVREGKLRSFQLHIAKLNFLDPACGSGNFLTETYLSLRRLENEVISELHHGQIVMDMTNPIQVSIDQFYGIEINDFAVTVAKTALWIAESQMMKETEDVVHMSLDFLPLKTNAHIVEGNALRLDWESVVPKRELNYIMGNPPFVGKKEQTKAQKEEITGIFHGEKGVGNLDYVTGWYIKALGLMENTPVRAAFVSTNSITQGEQVPVFWKYMLKQGTHIDFAYRTFQWDSEATLKAHVHCVIVGFSKMKNSKPPKIYLGKNKVIEANNINPYLVDAPSILVESRGKPLCAVPQMSYGSMPIDDGHLILEKTDVDALLHENKDNLKFVRKYGGGAELIQGKDRWCLWLVGASPKELQRSKIIMERIRATADFRRSSNRPQTLALADTPTLFGEIRQPNSNMLVIPKVSSEKRRYIPISYVKPDMIINGSALIIPDATLYDFGIITSNVHNAWMRVVAGRMKSDYQYSGSVVYNNFPWPTPTNEQRAKIEQTAQAILDARALYPDCSLADLYDEVTMPPELRKAHQDNDRAVMRAYGFDIKTTTEASCVAQLMKLYQALTNQ